MKLDTLKLRALLSDIRRRITARDSFEGTISWSYLEEGLEQGECEVSAVYRIDNIAGQGGTRIIAPTIEGLPRATDTLLRIGLLSEDETRELIGFIAARTAFRDPDFPERACDRCRQPYRGPAVYCCHACALSDGEYHA